MRIGEGSFVERKSIPGVFSSDCWGRLNEVADLQPVLATLDTLPSGFREARRTMLRQLQLRSTSHVLEAGCGPGTALPDLLELVGPTGRIVGVDPTTGLVDEARQRARAAAIPNVTYDVGDVRDISYPDETFDAVFCDKILTHVSPVERAIGELARITRRGGRVGAVEWFAQGMVIAAEYTVTRQVLDGSAPQAALNPMVPLELEQLFETSGLRDVTGGTIVAEAREYAPSLQTMLKRRVQQAIDRGAATADAGTAWLAELEARDARGKFYWAALVRWAAGTKG